MPRYKQLERLTRAIITRIKQSTQSVRRTVRKHLSRIIRPQTYLRHPIA